MEAKNYITVEELVASANSLCQSLEKAANDERLFSTELGQVLENYSWDVYKMANDIQELNYYYGG